MAKGNFKAGMKDIQFDEGKQYENHADAGDIKKGKKITKTKYTAGDRSPVHKIMSEVAKFAQKDNSSISKNKVSSKKVSKPAGGKQSSDFKKSSKKSNPDEVESEE